MVNSHKKYLEQNPNKYLQYTDMGSLMISSSILLMAAPRRGAGRAGRRGGRGGRGGLGGAPAAADLSDSVEVRRILWSRFGRHRYLVVHGVLHSFLAKQHVYTREYIEGPAVSCIFLSLFSD